MKRKSKIIFHKQIKLFIVGLHTPYIMYFNHIMFRHIYVSLHVHICKKAYIYNFVTVYIFKNI